MGRLLARGHGPLSWALALAAATLALALMFEGARPATRLPVTPPWPHFDKVLHFSAHFVLGLALAGSIALWPSRRAGLRVRRAALAALLVDAALGLIVELTQFTLGSRYGRQFEWLDVAANVAGAAAAALALLLVARGALRAYINKRPRLAAPYYSSGKGP